MIDRMNTHRFLDDPNRGIRVDGADLFKIGIDLHQLSFKELIEGQMTVNPL